MEPRAERRPVMPIPRDRVLLRQAASLLGADIAPAELFERLIGVLATVVDASVVFIALDNGDGRVVVDYLYDHGSYAHDTGIEVMQGARSLEVMRTGETIWGNRRDAWAPAAGVPPLHSDRPWTDDTVSAIFVPLRTAGRSVGCLSVQSTRPDAYDPDEVELVTAIGHFLAVAVANRRMFEVLETAADRDHLTGLATHSKIVREIDAAIPSSTSVQPLTVVLFNVVNFAAFNTTYGYAQGDVVLKAIANRLVERAGPDVLIGRFGGDVFAAVLHGKLRAQIEAWVDRMTMVLRGISYESRNNVIPIALACGYALAPFDAAMRADLVALATLRTGLSRKRGAVAVGDDDVDAYTLHGRFDGLRTILDSLLEHDPFLRTHLFHVNAMAKHWAEYNLDLGADDLAQFLQASLLHDVGKLLVSDRILVKPDKLTSAEYLAVQEHAAYGRTIITQFEEYADVADIISQHHERWDGAGYPNGLAAHAIHPLARAVSILDAFSAMTLDRPYHRGVTEDEALEEIERCSGSQFDPDFAARFIAWRRAGTTPSAR